MREIEIRLFGVLRSWGAGATLALSVPENVRVTELKALLGAELARRSPERGSPPVLHHSAVATECRILGEQELIPSQGPLAVLPPVCGG